jgi:hypothetical protein
MSNNLTRHLHRHSIDAPQRLALSVAGVEVDYTARSTVARWSHCSRPRPRNDGGRRSAATQFVPVIPGVVASRPYAKDSSAL